MRLSLLVATRGRVAELARLFESLTVQTYGNFEVILVDQNEDRRVQPVVAAFAHRIEIRHVRSQTRGHAAANNVALEIASGDVVAIPDDDCWYEPSTFQRVVDRFLERPECKGLTGAECAGSGVPVNSRRFDADPGLVTIHNIWRRHISFTMFLRREVIGKLRYDETLGTGAGTVWGSGEETDFLLRFIRAGNYVHYDPALIVYHPDWGAGPHSREAIGKAYLYGMGMGRVLQRHPFPIRIQCRYVLRPFAGGLIAACFGRRNRAAYHWAIFLGRVRGWITSFLEIPVAGA